MAFLSNLSENDKDHCSVPKDYQEHGISRKNKVKNVLVPNNAGGIPHEPLKKIAIPCEPPEKFNGLQRHCSNFLPSMPLPSDWTLTMSNCRCEKSKIPLSLNMSLFF